MSDFFRFPQTPHLTWLGQGKPRDDKMLSESEADELLSLPVSIEEKIDGANLGLSVGSEGQLQAQNRGQYLIRPYYGQFSRLTGWLAIHEHALASVLGSHLILFGEWCTARHSITYHELPDWFIVFDVYDRSTQQFWSTIRRNKLCQQLKLPVVPALRTGITSLSTLCGLMNNRCSNYGSELIEGLVIRYDVENFLKIRAKLIRPDFTQCIEEHWRRKRMVWNRLIAE